MQETVRILVVDDQVDVRRFLEDYLRDKGFATVALGSGAELRSWLARQVPELVLLDVGLPGEDGLSLARHIREQYDIGIIMVSGAGETLDRVVGLEVGADDYLAKPFEPRELLARVKSVLRRYQRAPVDASGRKQAAMRQVRFGNCLLDLDRRQLLDGNGDDIPVTAMEFDLLQVFAERPHRPLSRDQLMDLTQHRDWDPNDRSIDIRITRLRKKIEPDPDKPSVIRTIRGVGYLYSPADADN
ncbi:MAG TPA: response regulator [Candidatus Kapabacteria bacterium]|nr:response regulator [Candidatus Kapabacteria bacterium]